MFKFYQSLSNPTGFDAQVGGAISTTGLSGYLGETIRHTSGPPLGIPTPVVQYRKIFVKNEYGSNFSGVKLWLDAVEHPDQIKIGLASGNDTTTNALTPPTDIVFSQPTNYVNGLNIGNFADDESAGIWIRQELSGVVQADPYATFRIQIGGQEL